MVYKYFIIFLCIFSFYCCPKGNLNISTGFPKEGKTINNLKYSNTGAHIKIYSSDENKSFFEFPIKQAFLMAAKGEEEVKYNMAAFKFKDKIVIKCKSQELEKADVSGESIIFSGKLSGDNCKSDYTMSFKLNDDRTLEFEITLSDKSLNRIYLSYKIQENEQIFGFGEQYSHFNLKGKKLFLFTEEQGIGRGDQPITIGADINSGAGGNEFTSYTPIPYYTTTKNVSVFFENSSYSIFDFTNKEEANIQFWENGLKGTVWLSDNPLDLLERYTLKTGRFPKIPDWAYGTWLGLQGGHEKAKSVVDESIKMGNPVSALWIQDWVGRRKTVFGSQLAWRWYAKEKPETGEPGEPIYPDFKNFCKEMNSKNVKVLGYINSFLADIDPRKQDEKFSNPMLEEAKSKGYLVKDKNNKDYMIQTVGFPAYLIDLTNPEAVKWTKEIIKKNLIDAGLSGWMADFGEWLPYDAVLHSGISASVYHNIYPVDWARVNREAIQEAGKEGEIIFFTRAGYSYSNKYSTSFWLGDQMVSFGMNDGLASTIVGLNSSGISGIALNHSDIGGYTTIKNPIKNYFRSKELFLRWSELNAFTPIFRTHEGNIPEVNHQPYSDDPETKQIFTNLGKTHFALKDYFAHLSNEASEKGYPIIRHPYLHYPNDANTYNLKYQFMLGKDMMVIPIYKESEVSVTGYFPEGKWINIWTGDTIEGNKFANVVGPIGKPPVYVRSGGEWSAKILESIKNIK